MLQPRKIAQSLPDEDGNYVTYYALWSDEKDRWMIDIHFTDEMDSDFLQGVLLQFVDDLIATKSDMFNLVDIDDKKDLH